jgi:hypothetical protein
VQAQCAQDAAAVAVGKLVAIVCGAFAGHWVGSAGFVAVVAEVAEFNHAIRPFITFARLRSAVPFGSATNWPGLFVAVSSGNRFVTMFFGLNAVSLV